LAIECDFKRFAMYLSCVRGAEYSDRICGIGLPQPPPVPQKTPPPGSPVRGADIYEAKCGACHSLDANRIGPKHRDVFGRKSASVPGFHYSEALKKLNVVWNAQTLDRWLQNPTAMARGTAMGYRLGSAQERADVIAYLKQQSVHD
jgi:cytochrome c